MKDCKPLYTALQVKSGEVIAAKLAGIDMYQLMLRAGSAVFDLALIHYPHSQHWLIICGGGNNGGDGYVVAKHALQQGIAVTVLATKSPLILQGDALQAYTEFMQAGGVVNLELLDCLDEFDLVIDALLGTGLSGEVRGELATVIRCINQAELPVISVDIPSGLCSDTGFAFGHCIRADHTVTFIGIKQGLTTGMARRYVGHLHFASLDIEHQFSQVESPSAYWDFPQLIEQIPARDPCAHKGKQGRALLIGGDEGLGGAILIASRACIKTGAGLTACLTHAKNILAGLVSTPEVMFAEWNQENIKERLDWSDAIALGPGLGQSKFADKLFAIVTQLTKPKVLDADALNILASSNARSDATRIITPHPGEAARLLGCTVSEIESNRFKAATRLQEKYGGVVVLKGAGTVICDGTDHYVCSAGNSGMATGGMGDALTGVIISLLAQGIEISLAARLGVMIHSYAADLDVLENGVCGLTATDVANKLRQVINRQGGVL
ncbi:NAD(P)H-hydrate dehydratase [Vibrio taketomensis]|uniref:NAD(P)H-hydrate dehydratase n=1 Tax=Vibrio taketomensis TaxID=2572923 RepID=UPI00138A118A|nr:NAD(P)H-hydrate dehydratase [Vibrio taketomensis]